MSGIDFDVGIGLGASFIHNEKMTLSLLGDLGCRIHSMSEDDVDMTSVLFYVGPEIAYTFRFNERIGLFAN